MHLRPDIIFLNKSRKARNTATEGDFNKGLDSYRRSNILWKTHKKEVENFYQWSTRVQEMEIIFWPALFFFILI